MWQCPDCGGNKLMVTVVTSANLLQDDDDDNFETDIEGDHEWDDSSTMWCKSCLHVGTAGQFVCNLTLQPTHPDGPMPNTSRAVAHAGYRRRRTDGE